MVAENPDSFCGLNFPSNGFSRNISKSKNLKHWHFGQKLQPEYMGINMICMPQVDSNILDSVKFGVVS
jgi:hypothetical protein